MSSDTMASSQVPSFRDVRKLHRHYVYLDATEVINSLAGIEMGQEEERWRHTIKELGGNAGAKFAAFGMDVSLGGKSRRQLNEDLKLKQTVHSAAGALLKRLDDDKGVANVTTVKQLSNVFETLTVKFDAHLVPLEPVAPSAAPLTWWQRNVLMRKPEAHEAASRVRELGGASVVARAVLYFGTESGVRVGLQLDASSLMEDYGANFCRRATIVGKVKICPEHGEVIAAAQTDAGWEWQAAAHGRPAAAVTEGPVRISQPEPAVAAPANKRRLSFRKATRDQPAPKQLEAPSEAAALPGVTLTKLPEQTVPVATSPPETTPPILLVVTPLCIYK